MIYRTVYVDCTSTLGLAYTTGIQRVVRNIIERMHRSRRVGYCYVPVLNIEGKNFIVDIDKLEGAVWTGRILALATFLRNTLNAALPEPGAGPAAGRSLAGWDCLRNCVRNLLILVAQKIMYQLFRLAYAADGVIKYFGDVAIGQRDILFAVDSFWKKSLCKTIVDAKKRGCFNIVVIYDVIAITHGGLFNRQFRDNFIAQLEAISGSIDGVLSISRYSMYEAKNFLDGINPAIAYDNFPLGADFSVESTAGKVRSDIAAVFSGRPVYLMVGTLEPRKNHAFVLDAFERLWLQGSEVGLCFVGREGWLCDDLVSRIRTSPDNSRRLWHLKDVGDQDLGYCYRNARALIVASIVEGFGLPLVEAMHYQKPVFASDIKVFREVGEGSPCYFSLDFPDSLAAAVADFEAGRISIVPAAAGWYSWDEAVEILMERLEKMVEEKLERRAEIDG